jgi:hypothetical protein
LKLSAVTGTALPAGACGTGWARPGQADAAKISAAINADLNWRLVNMEALRPSSDERVQRRDLGRSRYDRRRVRKIEMYEVVETI